jgi:hypothetical protein
MKKKMNLWLFLCISVAVPFSLGVESADQILQKMIEKDAATTRELQSCEYQQQVRFWTEKKPGVERDVEEMTMRVRPRNEASFMILNPQGVWIHGGTPGDDLAKKGRGVQRNIALASLETLRQCFQFEGVGLEKRGELEAYRFHLKPKPEFKPKSRIDKVMKEVEADLWVDLTDYSVIELNATLGKPMQVAWLFATVQELRFNYQTVVTPMGRVMSGFDLELKLDAVSGKSTQLRRVRMSDYKKNPGQDTW